jgi:hypothetical protein
VAEVFKCIGNQNITSLMRTSYFVAVMVLLVACSPSTTFRVVPVTPAFSKTSVNATIFRKNSIVSHEGFQYVAFYDSTSTVTLAKRKLGTNSWEVQRTSYKGNTADAHNVISMMIDGAGYLHIAWDHHGHPLHYCRGIAPGSLQMGQPESMIGAEEEKVTYSEFYRLASGNLLFVYRDGSSGNGNMVLNRYDVTTRRWLRIQSNLLDGEGTRNAYWQLHVSKQGSIHLSWVWREHFHVETNHDMAYAVSRDEGKTWYSSDGKSLAIPIRQATAEYAWHIPQKSNLINQTSMTADDHDQPLIATYFEATSDSCPQYYVIYRDAHQWKTSRVTNRTLDFELGGYGTRSIPIARPQLLSRGNVLLMLYRDEEHQDRALMASADIRQMKWRHQEITDHSLDRWEPSYDTELWKTGQLHVYAQRVGQESGEQSTAMSPQMINVIEVQLKK